MLIFNYHVNANIIAYDGVFEITYSTNAPSYKVQEALSKIGLGFEDLYESTSLAEMFLIYSTAGTYGRLTTNTGVRLTTDLKEGDPTVLKQNYAKFGVDAKPVFVTQAKESGLDLTGWSL